jgi:hypothetical protein
VTRNAAASTSAVSALIGTLLTRRMPDEDCHGYSVQNEVQGGLKMAGRMWQFIERRSVLILLATVIFLVCAFLLWATLGVVYSEYLYEPKLKAADPGLYIYPQTRYAIFSAVQILWCTVGLFVSFFSLRDAKLSQTISERTKRSLILYVALLAVLLSIGIVMIVVRNYGY